MRYALAIAAALAAAPAAAQDTLRYTATVIGLPLGSLALDTRTGATEYGVDASFRMIPLLRQILDGDARARVDGAVAGGRYVPRTALFRYDDRDGENRLAIAFDETGRPVDLRADPPLKRKSYHMTLDEAAGAVDPATAAAILLAPRPRPCALSVDVFDGKKRHRLSLVGAQSPVDDGTVTCAGVYERVDGFKDKYMTPERRTWPFRAILAARGDRWLPLKITADTKFGPASATLDR